MPKRTNRLAASAGVIAGLQIAITLAAIVSTPGVSQAGDLFGFFRFFGHERAPAARSEPYAYADPREVPPVDAAPARPTESTGRATFCVRLCDGRFFPLTGPAAASQASAATACSAMCPASKTMIYRGNKIDDAAATNGVRYADLDNAFVYRDRMVAGCTCNGKDVFGLAHIDVASDPTLRAGDIVATADGLAMFKGGKGERRKHAQFTPIEDPRKPASDMRRHLATTR